MDVNFEYLSLFLSPDDSDGGDAKEDSASPEPAAKEEGEKTAEESSEPEGGPSQDTEDSPADDEASEAGDETGTESSENPMAMLLEEEGNEPTALKRNQRVEGTVLEKRDDQLVLDIGAKQEAIVPANDLARLPEDFVADIEVGSTVSGVVLRPDGEVVVSLFQALAFKDWDRAVELMESGEIIDLKISGINKGGVLAKFGSLEGFLPRSHLVQARTAPNGDLLTLVGNDVKVKVVEVSRKKRRLILSERQAMKEWRDSQKQVLISKLKEGDKLEGTVSSIADFGVFVDLGGADGLVHVSEISHERGKHPRELVELGQSVEVVVLSINEEAGRIGLSMKRMMADPWESVEQDHYVGELVEASISNLAKFGAFARLDDGLEGLIHVSEISDEHIEHPREAVQSGQRVTVEIIAIDPRRQRIGLSIRRVPEQLREPDSSDSDSESEDTE